MRYLSSRGAVRQPASPRINWSNPITNGLVLAWCGTKPMHELVWNLVGDYEGGNPVAHVQGKYGSGIESLGPSCGINFYPKFNIDKPNTMLVCYGDRSQSAGGIGYTPFSGMNSNANDGYFNHLYVGTGGGSDNRPSATFYNTSIQNFQALAPSAKTDLLFNVTGCSVNDASLGTLWHQGKVEASVQVTGTYKGYLGGTHGIFTIGDRPHFGGQDWVGPVYAAWVWRRELSLGEHRSMYLNPWQVFA